MELFTKKNIFIGLATIVAVPIALGIGVKAYDEIDFYFYKQSKRPAIELGKDYESLTKNIHSAFKEGNRENAFALYCLTAPNDLEGRMYKRDWFNDIWESVKEEDYSESTAVFDDSDKNQNWFIQIDNIKTRDGQIKSRRLATYSSSIDGQEYKCLTGGL